MTHITVRRATITTVATATASTVAPPPRASTSPTSRATTASSQQSLPCPSGLIVARNVRFGRVEPNHIFRTVEVLVDVTNETTSDVYMLSLSVRYSDGADRLEVSVGDDIEDPNRGKFAPGQRKTSRGTITAFGDVAIRGVDTETFALWQGGNLGRYQECGYPKVAAK